MKHILSTITGFFILLTSSVSWGSEEVGYGDLRIGSDRSVIDEYCIIDDGSDNLYRCYQLDNITFKFEFDTNKIINQIHMTFKMDDRGRKISLKEYRTLKDTNYNLIYQRLYKKFKLDGIWSVDFFTKEEEDDDSLITSFNQGTIVLYVIRYPLDDFSFFVHFFTEEVGNINLSRFKEKYNVFGDVERKRKEFLERF